MSISPHVAGEVRRPRDLHVSLVDVSKDYIRARITSGEFPPGF
ncbi:hypothetical protein [Tessaracoccus sp.]